MSKMLETAKFGTDWWNDSCDIKQLTEAVQKGATGATSNPVIVSAVIEGDQDRWLPVLDKIIKDNPRTDAEGIAWQLIEVVGKEAAKILDPVYKTTKGAKGFLSMQVNPTFHTDGVKMYEHGKRLATLAKNIAIKAPSTQAGYVAYEKLTADGINVNCTVSFSLAQAIESAETIERGLKQAKKKGIATDKMHPYITIMVGRIDDQIRRQMQAENIKVDPEYTQWAGVAVFKKAHTIFKKRGYQARLLAAAYRNSLQWSELLSDDVLQTIPYEWWNKFDVSNTEVKKTIERPVDAKILNELHSKFSDFRKVYDEDGMKMSEFGDYGATQFTINQFLNGYQQLLKFIQKRMS